MASNFNFPKLEACIFNLISRLGIFKIHEMAWVSPPNNRSLYRNVSVSYGYAIAS